MVTRMVACKTASFMGNIDIYGGVVMGVSGRKWSRNPNAAYIKVNTLLNKILKKD